VPIIAARPKPSTPGAASRRPCSHMYERTSCCWLIPSRGVARVTSCQGGQLPRSANLDPETLQPLVRVERRTGDIRGAEGWWAAPSREAGEQADLTGRGTLGEREGKLTTAQAQL
jgi:hypothetical protein